MGISLVAYLTRFYVIQFFIDLWLCSEDVEESFPKYDYRYYFYGKAGQISDEDQEKDDSQPNDRRDEILKLFEVINWDFVGIHFFMWHDLQRLKCRLLEHMSKVLSILYTICPKSVHESGDQQYFVQLSELFKITNVNLHPPIKIVYRLQKVYEHVDINKYVAFKKANAQDLEPSPLPCHAPYVIQQQDKVHDEVQKKVHFLCVYYLAL